MKVRMIAALLVLGLVAAACGSGDDAGDSGEMDMQEDSQEDSQEGMDHGDEEIDFGEPGDPADADRTVEVSTLDSFEYDPAELEIEAGTTLTFAVTNPGQIRHEFMLGGHDFQEEHEMEMRELEPGSMMEDASYLVLLEPGETKELTWRFTEPGEILYGCHEPGHYEAGMVGTITVR